MKLSEKVQKWWSLGGVIICRDHITTPCYEMERGRGEREGKEERRKGARGREGGRKEGGRKEGGRERSEKGKEEYSHEWKPQF